MDILALAYRYGMAHSSGMTESEGTSEKAQADKVAEGLIAFGQLFIALGITVLAIILLIAMVT